MNGHKDSAESHAAGMSLEMNMRLEFRERGNIGGLYADSRITGEGDKEVDEVTDMFKDLAKKKKKKSSKPKEGEDEAAPADGEFDPSALKKKKKKKTPKVGIIFTSARAETNPRSGRHRRLRSQARRGCWRQS